jgi:hypothetical protein
MISARIASIMAVSILAAALSRTAAADPSSSSGLDLGPLRLAGDEPSYLDFGAGAFNTQSHREAPTAAEGRIEFRYGKKLFYIGPALGVLGNTRGGAFGYAGIYSDIALGRFVLTPLGAVGAYRRGTGEDLGGTFQFRLSANLAYQFENRSRLGVQFAHISNAGIHTFNPGENELLVTYAIPLGLRF